MAPGDNHLSKQVAMLGEIAISGDTTRVDAVVNDMVLAIAMRELLTPARVIHDRVGVDIGYLAGMLTPALGNRVLALFDTQHPYFGSKIPEDLDDAYAMGQKMGKQYAVQVQTEQEVAKKTAQAATLGVMLPESGDTVSSDDATMILEALRQQRIREAKQKEMEDLKAKITGSPPGMVDPGDYYMPTSHVSIPSLHVIGPADPGSVLTSVAAPGSVTSITGYTHEVTNKP